MFFGGNYFANLPVSVASIILDGEQGLLLRIGDKNSVTFLMETCVLPSKGYAIAFGRVKTRGTIMAEDDYKDFVQINDGSWLPTRITRTNYKLDTGGVPYVATKMEMLAIEPPQLNVKLPENTFDLANTKEFQSLEPLFAVPFEARVNRGSSVFQRISLIAGIALIVIWFLLRARRLFWRGTVGLLIASVLSVSVVGGCGFSASHSKYDVILTDSGAVINDPSGTITIVAPVGMGVKKVLTIKSEYSNKIDAMTVSTSCGACSEVLLQNSEILPGETVTLTLYLKPEDVLRQHKIAFNVLIRHLSNPDNPFVIPVAHSHSEDLDGLQIGVTPPSIAIDTIRSPDLNFKEKITFRLGEKIDTGSLSVSADAHFIETKLNIEKNRKEGVLDIVFHNPPMGQMMKKFASML